MRAMSVWYRVLLVVCALPLGEVSCRVQGYNTLFMVADVVTIDPGETGAAVDLVEAAAGHVLGWSACQLFGKVGMCCALAVRDAAAADCALCSVCDGAVSASGRCRTAGEYNLNLLGGGGRLIGFAEGQGDV